MCFYCPSKIFHLLHSAIHRQSSGLPTELFSSYSLSFTLLQPYQSSWNPSSMLTQYILSSRVFCLLFLSWMILLRIPIQLASPVPSILDSKDFFSVRSILTSISNSLDHSHIHLFGFFLSCHYSCFLYFLNVFLSPQLE